MRIKTNKKTVNNRMKQSGTTFNDTKVNKTSARFHVPSKASSMDVLGLKTPSRYSVYLLCIPTLYSYTVYLHRVPTVYTTL